MNISEVWVPERANKGGQKKNKRKTKGVQKKNKTKQYPELVGETNAQIQ